MEEIISGVIEGITDAIGLVSGIVDGGSTTDEQLEAIQRQLDQIAAGVNRIEQSLKVVLSEIQWTQLVVVITDSISTIDFQYQRLRGLNLKDSSAAKKYADNLDTEEITKALFTINQAMMGESAVLSGAIVQLLAGKLNTLHYDKLPQSRKWFAINYLAKMIAQQGKGYAILLNALKAKGQDVDKTMNQMKERFASQLKFSARFIDPLTYTFQNIGWGEVDYFQTKYVDTHELVADDGKVVVGLQLYAKGNRIALKIAQATPDFDKVEEKTTSPTWKENTGWGEEYYFSLEYIDTNVNLLPEGMVVTGAALYLKRNRLGLKLRATNIDDKTGKFFGASVWQDSCGWGDKYFQFDKKNIYTDSHQIMPSIPSCLGGAALYQKGNRIAIEIYSRYCRYQ